MKSIEIAKVQQRYLGRKKAAEYAGIDVMTLDSWVLLGLKKIIISENAHPRFDIKDIDEFMNQHKI